MKSVDPGILSHSECFSFQPSEVAAKTMKYLTWCGHYFCTNSYFMERDTYPYVLVIFVRDGNMDVRYNGKNYLIGKGDVLLIDCVNPHYIRL
ncbi:MAG: AraC family ligand binding domain-containing protein [Selenomonadaceae bacterium]|nr:AraC family ligand binding domain-containing protein [Selenomonadaceae bacterium]